MSEQNRLDRIGPSEPESHTEHRAALDATLFQTSAYSHELVLELNAGELRVLELYGY